MSGQIFISYRREESRWSARSLHDRLCRDFDPEQIFMDIDAIALGEDFVKAIETRVAKCDVLIAVIGNNWLTSKDDHGDRRLDNPEDFVRMEIGAALKREISVIPVLVDAALMPRAIDLPEDLKSLVRRNALRITDTSFDGDCQRLAAAIRLVLEKAAAVGHERPVATLTPPAQPEADSPSAETPKVVHPPPPKPPSHSSAATPGKNPSKQVIVFLAIAAALVVAGLIYLTRASQSSSHQPTPLAAVTPSPARIATPSAEGQAPRQGAVSPLTSSTPQPTTPSPTPSAAESLAQAPGDRIITAGAPVKGSIVTDQDRYSFKFQASSTKTRVILRKLSKSGFRAAVDVYDHNEKGVTEEHQGVSLLSGIYPQNQPITLSFESHPGELYSIVVTALDPNASGDYELTVREE